MSCRREICLACALLSRLITFLSLEPPVRAADQWVKLETPHFELYTTAGEKKGREAILYFEQVRNFFLQSSPSKQVPEFPVRIVAFKSEKEYKPYRISESAFAYYTRGRSRDYIVMQSIASEHYPAAIHEYTHLIVEHTGLKLPLWLDEGWADLYSSLQPAGNKARVGDMLPGRVQTLLSTKWLDINLLSSVDSASPFYNERDRASIFYAQSWLLVHMLTLAPQYRANFPKFVLAMSQSKSIDEACHAAYGKRAWEIDSDFRDYLKSKRIYAAVFDIKLEKSAEEPVVSETSAFESDMMLADLLSMTRKRDEARTAYERLAQLNPGRPEIEESLGYLAWQSDDPDNARRHFARAFKAGSKNPQMCFHYAMLERQKGAAGDDAMEALERAVQVKPDYLEARLQLGLMLVNLRKYDEAIGHLAQLKKVSPDQAQWLFPALAYAYSHTGNDDRARENAELAKKWAKTQQQTENADSLLDYLDAKQAQRERMNARTADVPPPMQRNERPPFEVKEVAPGNPFISKDDKMSRVEGTAIKLDCSGDELLFHVQVDKRTMIFEVPDPERVVIKHSGEVKHDFACGPQKAFRVVVDYAILPDAKLGSVGIVRALEF